MLVTYSNTALTARAESWPKLEFCGYQGVQDIWGLGAEEDQARSTLAAVDGLELESNPRVASN